METQGRLYVFEGPDGVGKSTLARWFTTYLQSSGRACELLSFPGRDAGTLGCHVYELHHDPGKFGIQALSEVSLQLLHVAAHIDSIEARIKPLLHRGVDVILDRFWWSTFVYGLVGGVSRSVLDGMIALERSVWTPVWPHRLFVIIRSAPLRPESPVLWPRWLATYDQLIEQERKAYTVVKIPNELDLDTTQRMILENM